jgi:hypothetical protein
MLKFSLMKTHKYCLLIAVSACVFTSAWAQLASSEAPPRSASGTGNTRNIMSSSQETGTIIKKDIRWNSKVPLDKTYGELTPEQKAELHAMYETLAPGDEPPFPAEGIKPIFSAIRKAQRVLQARGVLNMAVTVDPDGKATQVEDLGGVYNIQMTEIAQQALLLTKYKPGVCNGSPCTMKFKFTQKLQPG